MFTLQKFPLNGFNEYTVVVDSFQNIQLSLTWNDKRRLSH